MNNDLKELNNKLEAYNDLLKEHLENHGYWHTKGGILTKIAQLTGDNSGCNEALACYNNAIELNMCRVYLIDRSKLYAYMDQMKAAFDDIQLAHTLPKAGGIYDIYVEHIINDIIKLNTAQYTIRQKNEAETYLQKKQKETEIAAIEKLIITSNFSNIDNIKIDQRITNLTKSFSKFKKKQQIQNQTKYLHPF